MFVKTNIVHDLVQEPSLELEYRFGEDTDSGWVGISYFSVSEPMQNKILKLIPQQIRPWMKVSLMVINRAEIPAHIDNEIKTSINFYVETADAVTRYHSFKEGVEPAIVKLSNQTDGAIFLPECLDTVGEFVAEAGDVWILDVKKPHSVSCRNSGPRVAYCAQSRDIDYATAVSAFGL